MCKLLLFIMAPVVVVILIGVLFGLGPFDRIRHYHSNQKLSLDFYDPNYHNGSSSCRNNETENRFLASKPPPASRSLLKPRMSFDQVVAVMMPLMLVTDQRPTMRPRRRLRRRRRRRPRSRNLLTSDLENNDSQI